MAAINLFATRSDLVLLISEVERYANLKFVESGVFPESSLNAVKILDDINLIPWIGIASHESSIGCDSILVFKSDQEVKLRHFSRSDGSKVFAIDELLNEGAVTLTPSGRYGDSVILAGKIGTASASDSSKKIMKEFSKAVKSRFKKIKAYWVGPEAMKEFLSGSRLTMGINSPRDFDLSID